MSDMISTPSQTQSTVSSEAFEALIDLLATDGIDEDPSKLPTDPILPQANVTLRDSSGKLDYDKIRMMFAAQNRVSTVPAPPGEEKSLTTVPHEDSDSDDEPHSHRSTSSTVPSRSHSMSPKPVEHSSAGHRRSSTFGNQPWPAIHENAAKVEDAAPALSNQPLSFDELNTALAGAHEEVKSLRRQYDELQALVSKRLGTEIRDQVKPFAGTVNAREKAANGRVGTRQHASSQALPSAVVPPAPPPSDVPAEIANFSENGAKRALGAIARSLNLSPSAMASLSAPAVSASVQRSIFPPNPTRQHDVASVVRALEFLGTVDELVWRRASEAPSEPRTLLPVFSEENIVALVARLGVWEPGDRHELRGWPCPRDTLDRLDSSREAPSI